MRMDEARMAGILGEAVYNNPFEYLGNCLGK